MNSGITKLLSTDGFIQVNKALIKVLGLHEAIIIGELCAEYNYWQTNNKLEDDMFFSTRENIEENTGLNEHYQRKAIKTLVEQGVLIVEKKGIPAKNYYRIVYDKLLILLSPSDVRDEGLDVNDVNHPYNKNKQTKINKQKNNLSKDKLFTSKSPKLYDHFLNLFLQYCPSYSKPRMITDTRKKAIDRLYKKYNEATIIEAMKKMEASSFCKGETSSWKANIDFILRQDKFVDILEGKYDNRDNTVQREQKFAETADMQNLPNATAEDINKAYEQALERERNGEQGFF